MDNASGSDRRTFLRQTAVALGASQTTAKGAPPNTPPRPHDITATDYPHIYSGDRLKMIAFPLGGVAAGSISLGGRGQLRDWEIFNKSNKGFSPNYGFPAIWAQAGNNKPVARVLEAMAGIELRSGTGGNE